MADFKTERYSVSKPSYDQYGSSMTVYFRDDSFMELDAEMSWDNSSDEVIIEQINAEYYNADDKETSTDNIDLEQMVIDICEHYNTFGGVELEMEKAYRADHA